MIFPVCTKPLDIGFAGTTFRQKLEADPRCGKLQASELDAIFDPRSFLTRVGVVFDRLEQLEF